AIALRPGDAAAHSDLGVAYSFLGDRGQAIASFQHSLQLQPNATHTQRNLGDALHAAGRSEEAIAAYRTAIAMSPTDAGAHNNLGNVHLQLGQLVEAGACYERAVQSDPQLLIAMNNLGDVLTKLDRPEDGLAYLRRVLALDPNFADGHLNMGVAYWRLGRFPEAEVCYRRAIALRADFADAHLNLGVSLLLHGHYEEGWHEYEWYRRSAANAGRLRHFGTPSWNGSPVEGRTILTYADQGFGDTLQCLRYLPLLLAQSRAARILVECQRPLIPLVRQLGNAQIEFIPHDSSRVAPAHDFQLPLFNLPLVLRHFEPMSVEGPYLHADEQKRATWRQRLAPNHSPRVGLVWAGNSVHADDRRRSMAPEMLRPILQVPGVTFVSLQIEPRGPLPQVIREAGVLDVREDIADFTDSAALLAELDLIITVDTSIAHLAGALGRPVWTMVSFVPDWRWGMDRTDTPWYLTMRLFRQPQPGDWTSVAEEVAAALRARILCA
ncbi:MAG TPA: tetratricopeptide repeat-containing glycosyltransferase family protein, partial [Chthoniobacter sp.]|nr:tetratricopeptide repeat-containing glycosyltransferase family protein [Chthoniobacter sp.]